MPPRSASTRSVVATGRDVTEVQRGSAARRVDHERHADDAFDASLDAAAPVLRLRDPRAALARAALGPRPHADRTGHRPRRRPPTSPGGDRGHRLTTLSFLRKSATAPV